MRIRIDEEKNLNQTNAGEGAAVVTKEATGHIEIVRATGIGTGTGTGTGNVVVTETTIEDIVAADMMALMVDTVTGIETGNAETGRETETEKGTTRTVTAGAKGMIMKEITTTELKEGGQKLLTIFLHLRQARLLPHHLVTVLDQCVLETDEEEVGHWTMTTSWA